MLDEHGGLIEVFDLPTIGEGAQRRVDAANLADLIREHGPYAFAGRRTVDSDAKCNPVDSIGSSTKSRVSHSERPPSARFPGDKVGSARRNIEPLQ